VDPRQRVKLIEQRHGARIRKLLGEALPALVEGREPLDRKVIRLRQIVDKVAAAIAPLTPCRKGCSACCHKAAIALPDRLRRKAVHLPQERCLLHLRAPARGVPRAAFARGRRGAVRAA
jgi:hypothetical protein